jgi:hypothetical protein
MGGCIRIVLGFDKGKKAFAFKWNKAVIQHPIDSRLSKERNISL